MRWSDSTRYRSRRKRHCRAWCCCSSCQPVRLPVGGVQNALVRQSAAAPDMDALSHTYRAAFTIWWPPCFWRRPLPWHPG
ncbi:hypothetical protein [Novosphingobium sp.]|uniref:hypothetical protein n=1 Tax=Novosphingobium sp. TaxID=1874826 RepID=UPI0031D99E89